MDDIAAYNLNLLLTNALDRKRVDLYANRHYMPREIAAKVLHLDHLFPLSSCVVVRVSTDRDFFNRMLP